ncbi:reverse transcriptase domain-containing protein [Tanacetum coccineum]
MLVEVRKFTFPANFVILEMEEDNKVPLILGQPFLHTADAVIRVKQLQLNLGVGTERMIFNIDSAMKHSYSKDDTCFSIDVIDEILEEDFDALLNEDYVSKWAEAQALPTNDARLVVAFLKKLFCHFGMPKALISDRVTHFYNKIMERTMKRCGVNHHFSTSYHPQTSGQVEHTNRALKRILEKTVKDNPAISSRKLDDALWAFHTAYKTPTGTTPYKLIYGKNYHLPFEIEHRAY